MNFGLYGPWLVVGGFALTLGALVVGSKTGSRMVSRPAFAVAGLLGSATTMFWLTRGTFTGVFVWLWALLPIAFTAFGWWRKYRQGEWMDRLAGRGGVILGQDRPGRPSFGVLPARGLAAPHDDPRAGFRTAVEADLNGHRVLGVQYTEHQGAQSRAAERKFEQALEIADDTYNLVQLRTPAVPSVLITPLSSTERNDRFGPLEPSEFRPLEDARITRNAFGVLLPEGPVQAVDLGTDSEFGQRFTVRAADEASARALLTPEVQQQILNDPWFRVRTVAFHGGALWTTEMGQLSESALRGHSRHLAQLAAVAPWGDPQFEAHARAIDTSPSAWGGGSFVAAVNERRIAADRVPLAATTVVVRVLLLAALIAAAVFLSISVPDDPADAFGQRFGAIVVFGGIALVLLRVTFLPKRKRAGTASAQSGSQVPEREEHT